MLCMGQECVCPRLILASEPARCLTLGAQFAFNCCPLNDDLADSLFPPKRVQCRFRNNTPTVRSDSTDFGTDLIDIANGMDGQDVDITRCAFTHTTSSTNPSAVHFTAQPRTPKSTRVLLRLQWNLRLGRCYRKHRTKTLIRRGSLNQPTRSPPFAVLPSDEASVKEEKEEEKRTADGADAATARREPHRNVGTSPLSPLSTLAPHIL
ncbi:hypothetical protein BLNAU_17184 [Blattamonas nauphoetae]|uniref:Uncharacterized protein n=1 Tax=Blattamonas nauphoetae TaxID=2049346 RepID=A0ABQ9XAG9_9EUKA|nr:hypothetical protein BLNAU_17184 [Blattamonas nauphoetae]